MMELFSFPNVLLVIAGFLAACSFVSSVYMVWLYRRSGTAQQSNKDLYSIERLWADGNETVFSAIPAEPKEADLEEELKRLFAEAKPDVPEPETTVGPKP